MLKLYSTPASPFAARVRIHIYKKDLPVEILPPPGDFGSGELKAINPLVKIPVLDTGEQKIIESEIIQEYLQEKFPEPSLLGDNAEDSARIRTLSRITDLYLLPALMPLRAVMKQGNKKEVSLSDTLAELSRIFKVLDSMISGDNYAISDSLSLADCSMAPMFFYLDFFASALELELPLDDCDSLKRWKISIENNQAVDRVLSEISDALQQR